MTQGLIVILLIALIALVLIPVFFLVNHFLNDYPEKMEDSSDLLLRKTEIKLKLLICLKDYYSANNLSIEKFSKCLSTNHEVVDDILAERTDKFTTDLLVDFILRTGVSLEIITKNINKQG
jgi:predicted XRE-type DNA-binding protein